MRRDRGDAIVPLGSVLLIRSITIRKRKSYGSPIVNRSNSRRRWLWVGVMALGQVVPIRAELGDDPSTRHQRASARNSLFRNAHRSHFGRIQYVGCKEGVLGSR